MENKRSKLTALIASFARAYHAQFDDPKIFYDPIARQLMTDEEYKQIMGYMIGGMDFFAPEKKAELTNQNDILKWIVQTQLAPTPLARARYCEDMLLNAARIGAKQYVILGAGMDTFAYRYPELLSKIHIYEVDLPYTQLFKRQKIQQAGLKNPDNLHYVPMDFTKDNLFYELNKVGFDKKKITFFSWLGVTYYLSKNNIAKVLYEISSNITDGSSLFFDYAEDTFFTSDVKRVQNQIAMAKAANEPMQTGYSYIELERTLSEHSFLIYEHLTSLDIDKQFFANRTDYLCAFEHINYALAVKKRL